MHHPPHDVLYLYWTREREEDVRPATYVIVFVVPGRIKDCQKRELIDDDCCSLLVSCESQYSMRIRPVSYAQSDTWYLEARGVLGAAAQLAVEKELQRL